MPPLPRTLLAFVVVLLTWVATVSTQTAPPPDPAAIAAKAEAFLQAHATVNGFSGSVLLARDGKPILSKGYGFANVEWSVPNTPQTKFRIGSITKQFTSMVIMRLREQGKIKIEDSVCAFIAPCPDAWKPVTIHHLLTHTSGIPTYTALPEWRKVNMVPKTVDEMIDFFRNLPLQWAPGEKYAYNNSGYFLLGAVIEKITGKKYEQVVREEIITPLGMSDSGYDWPGTIIPRRAAGYTGRGAALANAAALDMQQPFAAGSLYSTTEDLLKWDQALYTERLLPAAAKTLMWTPFLSNYAYGWNVSPPQGTFGHPTLAHSGGINGFSAMIIRVTDVNLTAIVLSNNTSTNASLIARDLIALYFGQPYTIPSVRTVAKVDPKIFDQYVGRYELRPDFIMTVTREGDSLITQATGQNKIEVFPESETKFFPKVMEASLEFEKDAAGKVVALNLTQGGRTQRAKKL